MILEYIGGGGGGGGLLYRVEKVTIFYCYSIFILT